jgi:hypothetical protein
VADQEERLVLELEEARRLSETRAARIASLIFLALVLVESVFVFLRFGSSEAYLSLFEETGMPLPSFTMLFVSPALTAAVRVGIALLAVAGIVKEFAVPNRTATLIANRCHLVLLWIASGLHSMAMKLPFVSVMPQIG